MYRQRPTREETAGRIDTHAEHDASTLTHHIEWSAINTIPRDETSQPSRWLRASSATEARTTKIMDSNMKSLVGDDPKILNDMVGSVTVSAWREQAERAAVRLCGETGKMMLHGVFPSICTVIGTADEPREENVAVEAHKRSGRVQAR